MQDKFTDETLENEARSHKSFLRTGEHVECERSAIEKLMTVFDVATILGKSTRTVTRMIMAGELPALRVRGSWRIQPISLRAWLDENEKRIHWNVTDTEE